MGSQLCPGLGSLPLSVFASRFGGCAQELPQVSAIILGSMERCQELVLREDLGSQVKVCRI